MVRFPHNQPHSTEILQGNPGSVLDLVAGANRIQEWNPADRRVHDLELRAQMTSCSGAIGQIPVIRWSLEIGHGDVTYSSPAPTDPVISGTPILDYTLPARGLVLRLSARVLRAKFRLDPPIAGPAIATAKVQVSIQPALGPVPVFPYQHLANPFAGVRQPFSPDHREWKLHDATGQPLAPLAVAITPVGSLGALLGPVDGALFADWTPIPHDATAWQASAAHWASFR